MKGGRQATGVAKLVRQLGSRERARLDEAQARLAMLGSRAVDALTRALERGTVAVRLRAIALLTLIGDPRSEQSLSAMLFDRDSRVREAAARGLARFASREVLGALVRTLERDPALGVRAAAVEALVEQYAGGFEAALAPVLEVLLDPGAPRPLRMAALEILPRLPLGTRRRLVGRLAQEADPELARRSEAVALGPPPPEPTSLEKLLQELAHRDFTVWQRSVRQLIATGPPVVEPLVAAARRRAHDLEFNMRVGLVLRGLGPRRARSLGQLLNRVVEPIPLQVLVETIGALGDKSLVYTLRDLIERLGREKESRATGYDLLRRVRARAHLELARSGSRLAIEDLRRALSEPQELEPEMLEALEWIGSREELPLLLRAYARAEPFLRVRVAAAVRAIMRRERVRRTSRVFAGLGLRERAALEAIVPPRRGARRRS